MNTEIMILEPLEAVFEDLPAVSEGLQMASPYAEGFIEGLPKPSKLEGLNPSGVH